MELTVGTIITGKVTTITKFGAFVALPGGKSGLVHTVKRFLHTVLTDTDVLRYNVLNKSALGRDMEKFRSVFR